MRGVLTILLLVSSVIVFAQKTKTIQSEYTYYAPENVTLEDAKRIALNRAKIQGIADEFGTIVSQSDLTRVENKNGKSSVDFLSLGGSDVKGEWIETIGEPFYNIRYEGEMLVVTCRVKGRAREVLSFGINYQAKILRNGIDDKYESDAFRSGDDLYLSFQSPIAGYLAVYLVDATEQVYCLLPYRSQQDGIYRVKANQHYLFFSMQEAPQAERPYVDEYVMTCERASEHNMVYVVFSPNQFAKAVDSESSSQLPRELNLEKFQKWLALCRRHDASMSLRMIPIAIEK